MAHAVWSRERKLASIWSRGWMVVWPTKRGLWFMRGTKHKPNPVVGSSQNNNGGFVSNSLANESRFFSPPDSVFPLCVCPIRVSMHAVKPSLTRSSCTNLIFSDFFIRRSSRRFAFAKENQKFGFYSLVSGFVKNHFNTMNVMCSQTVNAPLNRSSWCTKPLSRCMNGPTGRLFTRMSPFTIVPAALRWANADISVLLPAPLKITTKIFPLKSLWIRKNHIWGIDLYLAPMTANNTPGLTHPVELFMIRFVCFSPRINLLAFILYLLALANTDTFRQTNLTPRLLFDDVAIELLQSVNSKLSFVIFAQRSVVWKYQFCS